MTLPILVGAGVLVLLLAGVFARRSRGGSPAAGPGLHRCRACRGTGAVRDPSTKSGYGMCPPCSGTGWAQLAPVRVEDPCRR